MKTIIEISKDYNSGYCYQTKVEDINYLVNELDVFCETKNRNFINIIEEEKRYHSEKQYYKNKIIINAKGYSQGEWQDYILYYNKEEIKTLKDKSYLENIVIHLERTFTHQNDYIVKKYEQTEIEGKIFNSEPYDYTNFYINYIEFPNNEDIMKEYTEIYGKDFDEFIIEDN